MRETTPVLPDQLVEKVATITDSDPLDLPSLYESIGQDLLGGFVDQSAEGRVSVSHAGIAVTVENEISITIEE